jgi:hypothetical protein
LKVEGTEDTYLCVCNKIVYGEQSISSHMGGHQRLRRDRVSDPNNRTCKLEGCQKKDYIYQKNHGYIQHLVSVVLGQIHSTYNVAPSKAKVINGHWLESLLVNKVPVVASKVVVVKKAVTEMKLTARS